MPARLSEPTIHLLRSQNDLVASWQLPAAELAALRRAVRRGDTTEVTHRVFGLGYQPLTPHARAWAAVLHCGPLARLGGRAALVMHGWQAELQTPIDVVVPGHVRVHKPPKWMRIHRLGLTGASHLSPPRVPVHDAAVQSGAWARSEREMLFVLISALQQRLTTADRILSSMPPNIRNRRLMRSMVIEFRDGIQSTNEYDFRRLCRKYDLPEPTRQTPVKDARGKIRSIDVEFRIAGRVLRIEIEGMHHLNPDSWLDDIDRHNDTVLAGHDAYLRVATLTLKTDERAFMLRLRAQLLALAQAA